MKDAIPYLLNKKVGKTAGQTDEFLNPELKYSPWGMIGMRGPNLQEDFVDFEGTREGFGLLYNPADDLTVPAFRDGHGIYEG